MKKYLLSLTSLSVVLAISACSGQKTESIEQAASETAAKQYDNVLMAEFKGPYEGVPAFDKMDLALLKPAMEKSMALHLEEMDAIANNPEPANFANTIVPYEKAGAEGDRVFTYYGIWRSNMSSPEFREIQQEMAPKLSAFNSKIIQNEKLFKRIKAVYESDELKTLTPEEQRITQLIYNRFARNGATLNPSLFD